MVELKERLQGELGREFSLSLNNGHILKDILMFSGIEINKFMFTSVARPTVGIKRTSIWNLRVRD